MALKDVAPAGLALADSPKQDGLDGFYFLTRTSRSSLSSSSLPIPHHHHNEIFGSKRPPNHLRITRPSFDSFGHIPLPELTSCRSSNLRKNARRCKAGTTPTSPIGILTVCHLAVRSLRHKKRPSPSLRLISPFLFSKHSISLSYP